MWIKWIRFAGQDKYEAYKIHRNGGMRKNSVLWWIDMFAYYTNNRGKSIK